MLPSAVPRLPLDTHPNFAAPTQRPAPAAAAVATATTPALQNRTAPWRPASTTSTTETP